MELSGNIPASEKVNDTKETEDEENEMKAIIYLSLSKFDIKEITQLFNDRKEKILTYYLAKNMNDAGIKKLLKYKIVTLQNTITDLGWKEIENYIKITGGDVVNKQKVSEVRNAEQKHKKWWEFWK